MSQALHLFDDLQHPGHVRRRGRADGDEQHRVVLRAETGVRKLGPTAHKARETYRKEALRILAVVLDRALFVDRNLIRLVAHCVHLCDAVDTRFGGGTRGRGWRGFGLHGGREDDGVGGGIVRSGHILNSEQRGEKGDLQALAVRNVESVQRRGLVTRYDSLAEFLPVEIVVQDLNRRSPRSPGGILPYRDEDSRIRFPDEKALLSLPLKLVSASMEVSYTGRETRQGDRSLTLPR